MSDGRPITYTDEIGLEICARIALGESLRKICDDDDMPGRRTVFDWLLREDDWAVDFRTKYTRAREMQAESEVDYMNEIADDGRNDWMEAHDKDGNLIGWRVNGEHVSRSKLRIETRRWLAEKLRPKKYGPKLDLTSDGEKLPASGNVGAEVAALLADAKKRRDGK